MFSLHDLDSYEKSTYLVSLKRRADVTQR